MICVSELDRRSIFNSEDHTKAGRAVFDEDPRAAIRKSCA